MMQNEVLLWVAFNIFVIAMLALDLGVFHRKAHVIHIKEALGWSVAWILLSLLFNLGIYFWRGSETALEFLTGYLIEKSLSVDNIFVFVLIFSYFRIPFLYQHKVLFWGIVGALILRAIFIAAGITLMEKFHWTIYIFGGFLVVTGLRMGLQKHKVIHPENNPVLKLFRRFMPVTDKMEEGRFFVKQGGRHVATPLFITVLVVETTDLITSDPFIVYTSNVFAILGLRALYFAIAGMVQRFQYLHYGLSAILVFVGMKMLLGSVYKIPVGVALGVIAMILFVSVMTSIARSRRIASDGASANRSAKETIPHSTSERKDQG
jgi:tellurite resistance protein TerC